MDSISRVIAQQKPHDLMDLLGDDPAGNVVPLRSALATRFDISVTNGDFDMESKPTKTTLRKLAQRVGVSRSDNKQLLQMLFPGVRRGRSLNENVESLSAAVADYDGEKVPMAEGAARLRKAGIAALCYTSSSHTDAAPRWRVVAPFSVTMTPEEYAPMVDRLNGALGGIIDDATCWQYGRRYHMGQLDGGSPVQTELVDGAFIDTVTSITGIRHPDFSKTADRTPANPNDLALLLRDAPDWGQIDAALDYVSADTNRELWLQIGRALYDASLGGDDGFERWVEWSHTATEVKIADDRELRKEWGYMRPKEKPGDTGIGTLFHRAKENGWVRQRRVTVQDDDFDDVGSDTSSDDLLRDDVPTRRPAARQWNIAPYPLRKRPDITHDQLAIDLGRAGWDTDARWVPELGGWHIWDGARWELWGGITAMNPVREYIRAKAAALMDWAEATAATMKPEAAAALLGAYRNKATAMRQAAPMVAVETLARSNPASRTDVEQWDADDFLLGTPGGTVDLRTGEVRQAVQGDFITKSTAVAPAPEGAKPEAWLRFLDEVFPDDPGTIEFLQRLLGYALTGSTREHRFFLFMGVGRNGKGTILNTVAKIMADYAKGIPTSHLVEQRNSQHREALARLRGARLVRGAELSVGQVWDESIVKRLTGGDEIVANRMRQDSFEFTPKFTLIVDGNTRPRIRTTDVAMRARMTLVPFGVSFAGREDHGLADRLQTEWGAILRWMIDGAVKWQRDGLRIPESVLTASREYLDAEDTLAEFVAEEIEVDTDSKVTVASMYARYRHWCDGQGSKPMTKRALSDGLFERGLDRRNGAKNVATFFGVRLRDDFNDATDELEG